MGNKIVFVHALNLISFFRILIKKNKIDKVFYVSQKISPKLIKFLKKRVFIENISLFHLSPEYLKNEENLFNFVEELFKLPDFNGKIQSIFRSMDYQAEKLVTSLKKYLVYYLSNDVEIITLAQGLSKKKSNSYVLVDGCGLLKETVGKLINIGSTFSPGYVFKGYLLFIGTALVCLKKIVFRRKKKGIGDFNRVNIIFGQMFKELLNPEFKVFYRYFKQRDDVLYICVSKDSEIYNTLKADKKPVLVKNEIPFTGESHFIQLKQFITLFLKVGFNRKIKSIYVKRAIINIFYTSKYYETIFKEYKPAFYLKVRSDMEPTHPVATAVADKYHVKNIGYQHGPYPWLKAISAHIDFHYYGLFGKCFLEDIFSHVWPKNIKYKVLGPITVEQEDKTYNNKLDDKFVIGFLTHSYREARNVIYYPYKEYLEIICNSLNMLQIPNPHLIFKEKGYDPQSEKIIVDLCDKYNFSYEIAYHIHPINFKHPYSKDIISQVNKKGKDIHLHPSKIRVSCSSQEVIQESDIIIILSVGYSTTSWETLGMKKKLVCFSRKNISPHPFEKYLPKLIVRDKKEFENSMHWLLNMSQEEYEKQLQPVIDNCGKVSSGSLVKDFIESIENECVGQIR